MPKAIAIVAHHDDHVLWMGGVIQRLAAAGWDWTLVAMCVHEYKPYFLQCCKTWDAHPFHMDFQDYQHGMEFSRNDRMAMRSALLDVVGRDSFDLVFTHSRLPTGEYWGRHANHIEVREITTELTDKGQLGSGLGRLACFSYDVIYGGGTATCARLESTHVLHLTYPELILKARLTSQAPDALSSLQNLGCPCPNPEGFEGEGLVLPEQFKQMPVRTA